MLDQRALQYYLNAMGLPLWQLKVRVQEIDCSEQYIPAAIAKIDSTEVKIKANQPIIPAEVQAAVQSEIQPKVQPKVHAKAEKFESLQLDKSNSEPEKERANKILSPAPIINHAEKPITQQLQSIASDLAISEKSIVQLDSQKWFQLLSKQISSCSLCPARTGGQQSLTIQQLTSAQNSTKSILLLVETPSAREYLQTHYLNQEYRLLLEAIFYALKLDANIYISSILKCSSIETFQPGDKERINQESNNCLAFLKQELDNINPDLIVTLGPIKLDNIVDAVAEDITLEELSNQSFQVKKSLIKDQTIPLLATFHPAFLYRNPLFKSKALQHWIHIVNLLRAQASDPGTNKK